MFCILNKYNILYYNFFFYVLFVRELVSCYNLEEEDVVDRRKTLDFNGLIIFFSLDYFIC